jgi:class 3 adenylate cyclase
MTQVLQRTVLFADLRGSTAMYERLGNADATAVVTRSVALLARIVTAHRGQVVKTLGDGLMAVFDSSEAGLKSAGQMHDELEHLVSRGSEHGASAGLRGLRLQVALARGEVVEMAGDCFGDAVNVAARLLDHAGDNETLVTAGVLSDLPANQRSRFRSLDWMHLRGRAEPVHVHVLGLRRHSDAAAATQFGPVEPAPDPEGIRLAWQDMVRVYAAEHLPVVLGRSPQATFRLDDSKVSRSHARIDWTGGTFQLTDMSYNGTYVRFGGSDELITLRRGSCTLHGYGVIGLGGAPADAAAPSIRFDVLSIVDTVPHLV